MTDRVFGMAAAILSVLFLAYAVPSISGDWQSGADARYFTVGPRFFPYVAGSLTLLFALMLAIRPSKRRADEALSSPAQRNNVLLAMAISIAYALLLGVLGFALTSMLALAAFLLAFGERRWFIIAPLAIAAPLLVRYIFLKGFALELPIGSLELPL